MKKIITLIINVIFLFQSNLVFPNEERYYFEENQILEKKVNERLKIMGIEKHLDIQTSAKGKKINGVIFKDRNRKIVFDENGNLIKNEYITRTKTYP